MNLLVIDNSSVSIGKDGQHYTNALNGIFLDGLIEAHHRVTYFQFENDNKNSINDYNLEAHGISYQVLQLLSNKLLRYLYAYFMAFLAVRRADFVYIYYPTSFKYVPYLCRMLGKPYGLYIRGMKGLDDRISHSNYRHAFTIFTVSDLFTKKVNTLCGTERAHTIRPMVPYTDADVVQHRKYTEKASYSILYLGRIAEDKGLAELLHAAAILRKEGKHPFHLRIIGNGEYMEKLKELHATLQLQDVVSIEGPVLDPEEKTRCYLSADLYVLPTYHEGFPRTLYEAMIFGTPIVTTFVGGIPALMVDGENAKRIEPQSAKSIVDGLTYAMEHYEEMGRMARNGAQLVSKIVNRNRLTHAQHLHEILQHGQ